MYIRKPPDDASRSRGVRTLNQADFAAACASLMRIVSANYTPTLLIGIRTGGLVVAEAMARSVPCAPPVIPLTCRRPGTAAKSRLPFLHQLLALLPRRAVDGLRILEHRMLSSRRKSTARVPHVDRDEANAIAALLSRGPKQHRLLVVDDAVDSGVTLATVLDLLRGICPDGTMVKSAVVTVTLDSPRAMPDFALYQGVLCRFPWSFDAAC